MDSKGKIDLNSLNPECTLELTPTATSLVAKLQEASAAAHCLVVMRGVDVGNVIHLVKTTTVIGRDEACDVPLGDEGISRRHAQFNLIGPQCTLEDMGSTNGTFVNGSPITSIVLVEGDKILLGRSTLLKYTCQDELELEYLRQIHESASTDGLTGALNRKTFEERLQAEWSFAQRQGTDLGVLMIDLDHFKAINDTYGHHVGDQVLATVAKTIRDTIRTEDIFGRYGGEEFILLVRQLGLKQTTFLAERIRCLIEQLDIRARGAAVPATISVGVACRSSSRVASPWALVRLADQRLYVAKGLGRNCVVSDGVG